MGDDDIGAMWRELKVVQQQKRASNRESSEQILRAAGVQFERKNCGAHLIVRTYSGIGVVDFWPGTGRWTVRETNATSFGVRKLLTAIAKATS